MDNEILETNKILFALFKKLSEEEMDALAKQEVQVINKVKAEWKKEKEGFEKKIASLENYVADLEADE